VPTSATLTFYSNGGSTIQAVTTATISADGTITATLTGTNIPEVSVNNKVKIIYVYATVSYEQAELFDVVAQPIVNQVIDEDLFEYVKELRDKVFESTFMTSTAGTTNTLIADDLKVENRNLAGGRGEIFVSATDIYPFEVLSFAKSTGTITFSPTKGALVASGLEFTIRPSYKSIIDIAFGDYVVPALRAKIGQASNIIDSFVVKNLTVFKALQIICFSNVEAENDKWDLRNKEFSTEYANAVIKFSEAYDSDKDGNISDDETENKIGFANIKMVR
jgi:hypothetical protein